MTLPCGCNVGRIRGRIMLACLRTGHTKLFDFLHGGIQTQLRHDIRYALTVLAANIRRRERQSCA